MVHYRMVSVKPKSCHHHFHEIGTSMLDSIPQSVNFQKLLEEYFSFVFFPYVESQPHLSHWNKVLELPKESWTLEKCGAIPIFLNTTCSSLDQCFFSSYKVRFPSQKFKRDNISRILWKKHSWSLIPNDFPRWNSNSSIFGMIL